MEWSYSSNLTQCGGGTDYITLCPNGTGTGIVGAVIHNGNIQAELPDRTVKVGVNGTLIGPTYIGYQESETYYISSTCANSYKWYLKKEGQGGYVEIQNSSSSSLTLTSVLSRTSTLRTIAPPVGGPTTFYLYGVVKDAYNGSTTSTNIKEITAEGNVNLIVGSGGGGGELPEFPELSVIIKPNPVNNKLTLSINSESTNINSNKNYEVTIFNLYGEAFYKAKHKEKEININVSDFPKGLYVIYISDSRKFVTEPFIKGE